MLKHLVTYGWNDFFARQLQPGESPENIARVVQEHKEAYLVRAYSPREPSGDGADIWAEISGKMRHEGAVRADFPAVGDWVVLRGLEAIGEKKPAEKKREGPVQICRILPRRTVLARRLEGRREGGGSAGDEQVLAVNVDVAFLGTSLNEEFSVRRLERYFMLARAAGVRPVVLLTKADLCPDPTPYVDQVLAIAGASSSPLPTGNADDSVAIHPISVVTGQGMEMVRGYLAPGMTAVLLGSSGVGKSTLVNYLVQADVQDMMEARTFDDKGRHCTTFRHLLRTPMGGLIIDTPGLRGLSLGESNDARLSTFEDVETLAAACRFTNCRHGGEPGCAITTALAEGKLDAGRWDSYLKLRREATALAQRENRIGERKQNKLVKKSTAKRHKQSQREWDQPKR